MTFSLAVHDPHTGHVGVAAMTAMPSVGELVIYARSQLGAAATQAMANPYLAFDGLDLLGEGCDASQALATVIGNNPARDRQREELRLKRRRTTLLEVLDRMVVSFGGLALIAAGTLILTTALGYLDLADLSGMTETLIAQLEAWPAAAVIAVAAIVAILGTGFFSRHLLPAHKNSAVSELRLSLGDDAPRTTVRGAPCRK